MRACKVPNKLNLFFHLLPSSLSNHGVAWHSEKTVFFASCPNSGNFLNSLLQFLKVSGHMLSFEKAICY